MVHADKAIINMARSLVQQLKDPQAIVKITVSIETL
jgi:hypothetical protein